MSQKCVTNTSVGCADFRNNSQNISKQSFKHPLQTKIGWREHQQLVAVKLK